MQQIKGRISQVIGAVIYVNFDGKGEVPEPAPAVDYSGNELPELLDIMDKKLQAFAAKGIKP